jgi:hypothetical protein
MVSPQLFSAFGVFSTPEGRKYTIQQTGSGCPREPGYWLPHCSVGCSVGKVCKDVHSERQEYSCAPEALESADHTGDLTVQRSGSERTPNPPPPHRCNRLLYSLAFPYLFTLNIE